MIMAAVQLQQYNLTDSFSYTTYRYNWIFL